jgi:glycosyltransferase involved in cell wall biosynthesis
MRVALIQSDASASLSGRRALELARSLRSRGHDVTMVVPQSQRRTSTPALASAWHAEGFSWIPVGSGRLPLEQQYFPKGPTFLTAKALAQLVKGFDVTWFFERAWAMPILRERRFSERQLPVVVLDFEPAREPMPASLEDINIAFAKKYAMKWGDFNVPESENSKYTDESIENVERLWEKQQFTALPLVEKAKTSPAVTVCIPYYEEPQFLAEALRSLEQQTSGDFTVVVVDDGSHTEEATEAFAICATRYAERGWTFLRQDNQSAGAARNRAAEVSATEFLLFLDADDIAMPTMVERFLRAALLTGDDVLVAPNYGFHDDPEGTCTVLYDPPGNSLIGSMGDDMHGGSCIFVRREAFQQLGGFTVVRGVGFEDYEFHVRANLLNLRWDVLPEFIYRYRMPRAGGVSKSTSAYANLARVRRWYEERLRPFGLGQLSLAFASVYWANEKEEAKVAELQRALAPRRAKRSPQRRELKLLLLTCNFPFGLISGWHNRVQQLVRYFGSRYELTLMTSMPREQLAPLRKETFQNLHAVLGVEGSNRTAVEDPDAPFRVREHYTDVFQAAVRALPTEQYHAALMEQIFMAEFRKDLDTIPVLTEQNIESRLLRQASERTWNDSLPEHYRNALIESKRLERYEDRAWMEFPLRSVVSEVDRLEMMKRAPHGKTVIAPNGADTSTWLANTRFEQATVLFAGHLAYLPNVDGIEFLLLQIWPEVLRLKPNARLILAGRDPSDVVKAAVALAGGERSGIELVASPKSMDTVAQRASITVAPLRLGSGTRVKILDSMAWGLPVVSTALGAEGIDVIDGEHVLIRDEPQLFAEAIVRLLSDKSLWQKFRDNSGELVRERYSWDRVFEPLEDALLELIS